MLQVAKVAGAHRSDKCVTFDASEKSLNVSSFDQSKVAQVLVAHLDELVRAIRETPISLSGIFW